MPYPPQIVALAATLAILGGQAETAAAKEKLAAWFWSVTFGELYGSSTESRLARDVPELVDWIKGTGAPPRSMEKKPCSRKTASGRCARASPQPTRASMRC